MMYFYGKFVNFNWSLKISYQSDFKFYNVIWKYCLSSIEFIYHLNSVTHLLTCGIVVRVCPIILLITWSQSKFFLGDKTTISDTIICHLQNLDHINRFQMTAFFSTDKTFWPPYICFYSLTPLWILPWSAEYILILE